MLFAEAALARGAGVEFYIPFAKDAFASKELIGKNSILEARLNKKGPGGLPWFQDRKSHTDPKKLLAKYVDKLGVKHLVQGHQPGRVKFRDGNNRDKYTFFQRYGLLFLIGETVSVTSRVVGTSKSNRIGR